MYLAIDYGTKRVGIAIGEKIAFSRGFLNNDKELMHRLLDLIHQEAINTIVVGWPVKDSGLPGDLSSEIKKFADKLYQTSGIKVVFENENDTSHLANQKLKSAGVDIRSSKSLVDGLAAAEILEQFLHHKN